ncbi:MAG TPA: hypothetical protein GXX29_11555, partial [Firmicutes bacterium]|nr:hypothetical protein [Bacillota bacterium]
ARRVAASAIGFIPAGPSSLEVVPPGQETAFAASLPLHFLAESGLYDPLGIGGRLAAMGIRHLGELTAVPKDALLAWFGAAAGTRLHELARGWDPTPVKPLYPPDRISLLHRPDPAQPGYTGSAEMEEVLAGLCTSLAGILADRGLGLRRLSLNLVFRHCSRQESLVLPHPVSERMVLTAACRRLWQRLKPQEEVLEIVLQGWDLAPRKATQLDLYRPIPSQPAAAPGLEAALYPLRARFGPSVLRTAAELPLTRRERVREMWERECL